MKTFYTVVNNQEIYFSAQDEKKAKLIAADSGGDANHVFEAPLRWIVEPDDREGMEHNNHIVNAYDPNLRICFMAHGGKEMQVDFDRYARLIAAAPELLEALESALRAMERIYEQSEMGHVVMDAIESARAAIEKARDR